ncbi:MAG: translesion error-prone DNA polymerase V autoproteolytic subunit [Proteobacteria bacterium]|nr:translesion error-prone DNA polymerase V autoproteolytic subunit [Pseudomonadota bacterium]
MKPAAQHIKSYNQPSLFQTSYRVRFSGRRKNHSHFLSNELDGFFYGKVSSKPAQVPLFVSRVQAGFPSPADEYCEGSIDLNDYLLPHKATTFFVRVTGDSMTDVGIFPDDMLVVDRSLTPSYGKIVIALLNGEMTVKRIEKVKNRLLLCAENDLYPDIQVNEEDNFAIWGVVTNVIHSLL